MVAASSIDFPSEFERLNGHPPLRWQSRLFHGWLLAGRCPSALDLPTGLGKTSVMIIWYLAFKAGAKVPRRLIYVVDRRAVVDQATTIAEEIQQREVAAGRSLHVSTLRGQHADNRQWLADPTAPAIIVGTIDMIGSRLLFSGYGVSRRMRPYHAGFLGTDSLFVLDEAHLSRPFRTLLATIAEDPDGVLGPAKAADGLVHRSPRFLAMSATGGAEPGPSGPIFSLEAEDETDVIVRERLAARKCLSLRVVDGERALIRDLVERAWMLGSGGSGRGVARVLVYCDSRQVAVEVKKAIERRARKEKIPVETQLLVGERRVHEREALFDWLGEHGFVGVPGARPPAPTFLVATSAGEVGVDLDADHMVCDLVEWERMVQRLGRVNRRGRGRAEVEVLAAPRRRERPEDWSQRLTRLRAPLDALSPCPGSGETGGQDGPAGLGYHDASPGAIRTLTERARHERGLRQVLHEAAVSPPLAPALSRALVDAWALTSLEEHAGRPEVGPWLRGWEPGERPQASVIWRRWLPWPADVASPVAADVERFFSAARPHLVETLEADAFRVVEVLAGRAERCRAHRPEARHDEFAALGGTSPAAIVLRSDGRMVRALTVVELAGLARDRAAPSSLGGCTIVVAASLGGLNADGMLDSDVDSPPPTVDASGRGLLPERVGYRVVGPGEPEPEASEWRLDTVVVLREDAGTESEEGEALQVFVARGGTTGREGDPAIARRPQSLEAHHAMVAGMAREIADALGLPEPYREMLVSAARAHDAGKARALWQNAMGAPGEGRPYGKTVGGDGRRLNGYRHEFGSLGELEHEAALEGLPADLQELARHLVASHHGHARPGIFPFDPEAPPQACDRRAREVALRFVRLQRRWGPWGLAWWESLLRAADQRASRRHDEGAG